jgi:hypothetical protein
VHFCIVISIHIIVYGSFIQTIRAALTSSSGLEQTPRVYTTYDDECTDFESDMAGIDLTKHEVEQKLMVCV